MPTKIKNGKKNNNDNTESNEQIENVSEENNEFDTQGVLSSKSEMDNENSQYQRNVKQRRVKKSYDMSTFGTTDQNEQMINNFDDNDNQYQRNTRPPRPSIMAFDKDQFFNDMTGKKLEECNLVDLLKYIHVKANMEKNITVEMDTEKLLKQLNRESIKSKFPRNRNFNNRDFNKDRDDIDCIEPNSRNFQKNTQQRNTKNFKPRSDVRDDYNDSTSSNQPVRGQYSNYGKSRKE